MFYIAHEINITNSNNHKLLKEFYLIRIYCWLFTLLTLIRWELSPLTLIWKTIKPKLARVKRAVLWRRHHHVGCNISISILRWQSDGQNWTLLRHITSELFFLTFLFTNSILFESLQSISSSCWNSVLGGSLLSWRPLLPSLPEAVRQLSSFWACQYLSHPSPHHQSPPRHQDLWLLYSGMRLH